MTNYASIINKVASTTGAMLTQQDISLVVYLASSINDPTIEALEHLKHMLRKVPDVISIYPCQENELLLAGVKKLVNKILMEQDK